MDHKPLLQERPPAYNLEAGQGEFACAPHGYGAIAAAPPPPYPYLVTGAPGPGPGRGPGARVRTSGGVPPRPLTPKPTFLRTWRRRWGARSRGDPGVRPVQAVGDGAAPGTGGRAPESGHRPSALSPSAGSLAPSSPFLGSTSISLQGYLPTTPGSTTSTVGMSPGTLPIPSLWSEAAQFAGSGSWRTRSPSWASSWPSSCSPLGSSAVSP
ncbi:hypothetical protein CapIbe_020993 [Capra ibex]